MNRESFMTYNMRLSFKVWRFSWIALILLGSSHSQAQSFRLRNDNRIWIPTQKNGNTGVVLFNLDQVPEFLPLTNASGTGIAVRANGDAWVLQSWPGSAVRGFRNNIGSSGQSQISETVMASLAGTTPVRVAEDRDGNAWVATGISSRLLKVTPSGEIAVDFTNPGGALMSLAIKPNQNVVVADTKRNEVIELSSTGEEVGRVSLGCPTELTTDRHGDVYTTVCGSDLNSWIYRIYRGEDGSLQTQPLAYSDLGRRAVSISVDGTSRLWIPQRDADRINILTLERDPNNYYLKNVVVRGLISSIHHPSGVSFDGEGFAWVVSGVGDSDPNGGPGSMGGDDQRSTPPPPQVTRVEVSTLETVGVSQLDAITDQLPSAFGDFSGFHSANVVNQEGDADGDGWPNGPEIDAGKNPFDRASHPRDYLDGNVHNPDGSLQDVLFINDSSGGLHHEVTLYPWETAILYVFSLKPRTEFRLYSINGEPEASHHPTYLGDGIGWLAFPPAFAGQGTETWSKDVRVLVDNLVSERFPETQKARFKADLAPTQVFRIPLQNRSGTMTIQGIIKDDSPTGYSTTNGVIIRVR